MTNAEYHAAMDKLAALARDIAQAETDQVAATIQQTHSVGAVLFPTEYRDGLGRLERQATVVRAIRTAQRVLAEDKELHEILMVAPQAPPEKGKP